MTKLVACLASVLLVAVSAGAQSESDEEVPSPPGYKCFDVLRRVYERPLIQWPEAEEEIRVAVCWVTLFGDQSRKLYKVRVLTRLTENDKNVSAHQGWVERNAYSWSSDDEHLVPDASSASSDPCGDTDPAHRCVDRDREKLRQQEKEDAERAAGSVK